MTVGCVRVSLDPKIAILRLNWEQWESYKDAVVAQKIAPPPSWSP